jgi:phenylpyruvate tautomerase PptA (4-oxalocrotonate tautomerase family)
MPFIRVNCPTGALNADQKAELAPLLVKALIRQEIDPVTEIGTAATGFFYNEIDASNCFPGGVALSEHPENMFWTVEAFVAASFFSQPRRDEMQTDIANAFVEVLGHDGSILDREDIRISPAYLMRLHVVVIEIPEGSWGARRPNDRYRKDQQTHRRDTGSKATGRGTRECCQTEGHASLVVRDVSCSRDSRAGRLSMQDLFSRA